MPRAGRYLAEPPKLACQYLVCRHAVSTNAEGRGPGAGGASSAGELWLVEKKGSQADANGLGLDGTADPLVNQKVESLLGQPRVTAHEA